MRYKHLSITEHEKIYFYRAQGLTLDAIAQLLGRHQATISRELNRNPGEYSPSKAQAAYKKRRKNCCSKKRWSPEQIANRLQLENYPIQISYKTIYRAIYAGMFDTPEQRRSTGNRGAIRRLRHRGKPRRPKGYVSNRGKIPISHELKERPIEANERSRKGDWEIDTIVGFNRKSGLLTFVDRKSRFLICRKLTRLGSKEVETALIASLQGQPVHSITSDRGREFQPHGNVTAALDVEFYFAAPYHPWERGTNENTNGLLREYFPKGYDFNTLSEEDLQAVVDQLNQRPRKCLGYRTPWEVYFLDMLHFT